MKEKIKLAVVDDSELYRNILINHLSKNDDFEIIIESSNGKEFIEALHEEKPDVVLLDLQMPIMCGKKTTQYLSKHHPQIKNLILTVHNDEVISLDLIEKGAHGFLLKDKGFTFITEAIRTVSKHKYYFNEWDLQKIVSAKNGDSVFLNEAKLTKREIEVINLLFEGLNNKEISEKLFISNRTVEVHRNNVLQKTNTSSLIQLVLYATRNGIIKFSDAKK